MAKRRTRKERKRLVFISLIIVGLLIGLVCSVSSDFQKVLNNKKQTVELSEEYENLLDEQNKLESEVTKMKDPAYLARYAKEKYLYSEDGEIIIRIDWFFFYLIISSINPYSLASYTSI